MAVLRFFFDYGAGGCLWVRDGGGPVDAADFDLAGQVVRQPLVRLSDAARWLRDRLDREHSAYLNPVYPMDPSLWTQAQCDRFNAGVAELLVLLRAELAGFEIADEQPRYAEDPGLSDYLAAHRGVAAIDRVAGG